MNRITTNIILHKCLFCCFRCAALIITLSHNCPSRLTICWFRPINALIGATRDDVMDHDGSSALRFLSSPMTTFGQFVAYEIPEIFRKCRIKK